MKPVALVHRFSFKIIAGLIAMLFLVGIPFFFVFLRFYRNQLLETMETSTTNMSRIMTHQLEVSVLEGRHHDLERVVERLSATGDARKIMVIDADEKVMFSSDRSQLGRTLMRQIEPGCKECHSSVVLKDTILLKIFEPFFSRQAGGQGTGLGLFICKSIVSSWGGEINVESRINQGTKFTLSFPVQT